MRRSIVPVLALLALNIGVASADAYPNTYIGPTYFSSVDEGGPTWSYRAVGATMPVAPGIYGADPDVSGSGQWAFSDANNTQGTISPGIGFWPRGFTPPPVNANSRAVMGNSPAFMLAVQRRYQAQDFVVFVLDFAGDNILTGDYYTCGPAAFQANPATINTPAMGAPTYYDGPFYAEGKITLVRGTTPPSAPAASDERYGLYGLIGGESPYCDQARNAPALWTSNPAPPPPASNDARRPTALGLVCNRGPDVHDPSACTATVTDAGPLQNPDGTPAVVTPTGIVRFTATKGGFPTGGTCQLVALANTPGSARCTATYTPDADGTPAGTSLPVTAAYDGSAVHKPVSLKHKIPGDDTNENPPPNQPVVCGPAPLPACEGLVPAPGRPAVVCVAGSVNPSCSGVLPPKPQVKVCGGIAGAIPAGCPGLGIGGAPDGLETTTDPFINIDTSCGAPTQAGVPHAANDCLITLHANIGGSQVAGSQVSALMDNKSFPGMSAAQRARAAGATTKLLDELGKLRDLNNEFSSAATAAISKLSTLTDGKAIADLQNVLALARTLAASVRRTENWVAVAAYAPASERAEAVYKASNEVTDAFGAPLFDLIDAVGVQAGLGRLSFTQMDLAGRRFGLPSRGEEVFDEWVVAMRAKAAKAGNAQAAASSARSRKAVRRLLAKLDVAYAAVVLRAGQKRKLKLKLAPWLRPALRASRKPVRLTLAVHVVRGGAQAEKHGTITLRTPKRKKG